MNKQELLQVAKPILFNTEMVQAIQDNRKTVTRRVVKPQPPEGYIYAGYRVESEIAFTDLDYRDAHYIKLKYKKDDILYVRETFGTYDNADYCLYKADYNNGQDYYMHDNQKCNLPKWRPSIHMPKKYARIFLKVTDVRVERLQEIDEKDCFKEGALTLEFYKKFDNEIMQPCVPFERFIEFWNSTIKEDEMSMYAWEENPWVFVYEFEKIDLDKLEEC